MQIDKDGDGPEVTTQVYISVVDLKNKPRRLVRTINKQDRRRKQGMPSSKQTSESAGMSQETDTLDRKNSTIKYRQHDALPNHCFAPDLFACMFLSGRRSISLLVDQQAAVPAAAVNKFRAAWAVAEVAALEYLRDRPALVPLASAPPCLPPHLLQQRRSKATAAVADAADQLEAVDGIFDHAAAAGRRYSPRRTAVVAVAVA